MIRDLLPGWCIEALRKLDRPASSRDVAAAVGTHHTQVADALRALAAPGDGRRIRVAAWQRTGGWPRRLYDMQTDLPDAPRPEPMNGTQRARRSRSKCAI